MIKIGGRSYTDSLVHFYLEEGGTSLEEVITVVENDEGEETELEFVPDGFVEDVEEMIETFLFENGDM